MSEFAATEGCGKTGIAERGGQPVATFPQWQKLQAQAARLRNTDLGQLFAEDPGRAGHFSLSAAGITLDYSKNLLDREAMQDLLSLAGARYLPRWIKALETGELVNNTEGRPALHTALRSNAPVQYAAEVQRESQRVADFVDRVHAGEVRGFSGKPFARVINIGIGGSDLGPKMVSTALQKLPSNLDSCFVSNVDGEDIALALADGDPETTLFVVSSKTFTTQETLRNAETARAWLRASAGDRSIDNHFIAVTAAPERALEFGMRTEHIFPMWDWVGGRYSLWSAIGISIALSFGNEAFAQLRDGAAAMDEHFQNADLAENLPVIMALLGVWYTNFWSAQTQAIIPYAHALRLLPSYLQQLEMESNGKRVTRSGLDAGCPTGPIIWGEAGTNGQHSFHQLLHQGTHMVPVDFILPLENGAAPPGHQELLVANCLAQARALMTGKTLGQSRNEFAASGCTPEQAELLAPARVMPGNRPSNLLMMDALTPQTLGALIALYEHKVFVQSVIWGINAFDQWGVELGKQLCGDVLAAMRGEPSSTFDDSTNVAIARYRL